MRVILAFGGNLPFRARQPIQTILAAIHELATNDVQFIQVSRPFQTPCFPKDAGPDFVNVAAEVEFDGTPDALLALCHATEATFGRTRDARWSARTLDIDITAAGTTILPDKATLKQWMTLDADAQTKTAPDSLIVPHPRLQDRAFVVIPMADIAPDWTHPITGETVAAMQNALLAAEKAAIWPIQWPQGAFDTLSTVPSLPK